ncbi:DUF1015 family protein [Neolewinella persica]|uniref:DUF1015 family protein n=1 Tax=Neolewinella persica TaxID=70998 RepID=UPI00036AAEF8|nr:DUF1015 family protein [Neolewinella persica]
MSVELLPFPKFYHLPFGSVVGDLPNTRNGVSSLPDHIFDQDHYAYAHLTIRKENRGENCTGICGLLPYSYFLDGTVRPHEQTLLSRLNRQETMVLADNGALGKPVLLTVPSLKDWWAKMDETHSITTPCLDFVGKENYYELRSYHMNSFYSEVASDDYPLPQVPALSDFGPLCIADGHHRAETHARLGAAGVPGFEFVPVCLIGADELTIGAFARLIDDDRPIDKLLPSLTPFFEVEPLETPQAPVQPGEWLLTRNGRNFRLRRKDSPANAPIDVEWLEHTVLPAIFNITDTRSDQRITFEPVENTAEGLVDFLPPQEHICLVGFPLPKSIFFAEIEAGRLLPPKSTRFEPRVPSGLIVWKP